MKAVSYSLFRHPAAEPFLWRAYVRGLYFNVRMNRLLYPGWVTAVFLDHDTATRYGELFASVGARVTVAGGTPALCEGMLWRMIPIFDDRYTHVLCRDADAITTYREASAVTEWLGSGKTVHALHDDPMHLTPLMGGMCGFDCRKMREAIGYRTWREMITAFGDLSRRFSDQIALEAHVYPKVKHDILLHELTGGRTVETRAECVDPRLWESNLTCRHIGSAGIVELETIRFFKRFDAQSYDHIEKRYPEIFHWHDQPVRGAVTQPPAAKVATPAQAISVCYTSARPDLVSSQINEWIAQAGDAEAIEFVVTIDGHLEGYAQSLASLPRTRVFVNHGRPCCVDGWNLAARKARGNILVQCSDDLHPPARWDLEVRSRLADGARTAVLAISDGLTAGVQFIPHAIITRRYYAELGYLFHDSYWSMWCDNELSAVAHKRGAVVEALDIRFFHAHGQFKDEVQTRHEASFRGEGRTTFQFRSHHGFEPWQYSAFVGEDGDSDGIYSPNWRTRLPAYWGPLPRNEALYLELHRDSHARRQQRFGSQQPIETLQALIAATPGRGAAVDLLAAELARQGISFLVDDRDDVSVDDRRARLLARSSSPYVTFMDDETWISHNYGELVADAIANNGGSLDVILHDAVSTEGDGKPRSTFFSFDRDAADLPDCRLRRPDHSMVWRRDVAADQQAARWARIHGLLRFHETPPAVRGALV